jgi:outer membrane protein assembly factor BamB
VPTGRPASQARESRGRFGGGGGALVEHNFLVLCLDRATGKILWQRTAVTATPHEGYHDTYGSFASNAPVTDGERLYAFFGSRGLYSYDLDGNLVWKKDFGVAMTMLLEFGEGVGPALHGDTLLLKFDHEGDSFIVALDKKTGDERWRQSRDERSSWSEPRVIEHNGRTQAIVSATNKTRSYDLATGDVIWEVAGLGRNVIPMPVHENGLVIVMSGYRDPNLLAIRLGRNGDLTGTDAILWTNTRGNSYTPSPVLLDGKLYFLTDNGMISCLDAATGKPYYQQQRLPKPYNFKASLVAAAGRLYLASEDGDVVVLKLGEQFEVLATNTLSDQTFIASPAITGGELFLRGQSTLYCIRESN